MNTSQTRDVGNLLEELLDREAIRDCLYRYCRGIDRADVTSLRSSYWPDAYDRHGAYVGPAEGFIDLAQKIFKAGPRMIHQVSNILIEFKSQTQAAVESYFHALQRGPSTGGQTEQVLLAGRYCDLFEKRGQEWRVLDRPGVYDWVGPQPLPTVNEDQRLRPRKAIRAAFPLDPSYVLFRKK